MVEEIRGERKKYFSNDLRSLAKPVEFGQTLPVYFTACSSSYSMFTMERFIEFYFELGLVRRNTSVISSTFSHLADAFIQSDLLLGNT